MVSMVTAVKKSHLKRGHGKVNRKKRTKEKKHLHNVETQFFD